MEGPWGSLKIHNNRTVISLIELYGPTMFETHPQYNISFQSQLVFPIKLNWFQQNHLSIIFGKPPQPEQLMAHFPTPNTNSASTPPICEETTQPRRDLFFHKQPWWMDQSVMLRSTGASFFQEVAMIVIKWQKERLRFGTLWHESLRVVEMYRWLMLFLSLKWQYTIKILLRRSKFVEKVNTPSKWSWSS